jgi:hypothetical protein
VNEFDNDETGISQYSSQTNGVLAEWIYAPESSLVEVSGPGIVVQFHGTPLKIRNRNKKGCFGFASQ